MALSWGRRPIAPGRASPIAFIVLAVVTVVAAVASGPAAWSVPPPPIVEEDTPQRIQDVLDQHVAAIEKRDLFVYQRTLDRRDPAFDRCMRDAFDRGEARVAELSPARVLALVQVAPSLVRLEVQEREAVATWYARRLSVVSILTRPPFDIRRVFYVWYLSTPDPGEIADRQPNETCAVATR